MRKLARVCVVLCGVLAVLAGCGSGAGDRLVLSFVRFDDTGITQEDAVHPTFAEVDICPFVCGTGATFSAEPFTQTSVNGVFVNFGRSDILVDRFTLSVPGTGIDPIGQNISVVIPGGRCLSAPSRSCVVDDECAVAGEVAELGECDHAETSINLLLYDFDFKQRILLGQCPSLAQDLETGLVTLIPGQVIPQRVEAILTFSGTDDANQRFTVSTGYVTTFDNFDNCAAQ